MVELEIFCCLTSPALAPIAMPHKNSRVVIDMRVVSVRTSGQESGARGRAVHRGKEPRGPFQFEFGHDLIPASV